MRTTHTTIPQIINLKKTLKAKYNRNGKSVGVPNLRAAPQNGNFSIAKLKSAVEFWTIFLIESSPTQGNGIIPRRSLKHNLWTISFSEHLHSKQNKSKQVRSSHRSDLKLKIIHGNFFYAVEWVILISRFLRPNTGKLGQIPVEIFRFLNSICHNLTSQFDTKRFQDEFSSHDWSRMVNYQTWGHPSWVSLGSAKQLTGSSRWCMIVIYKACNESPKPAP